MGLIDSPGQFASKTYDYVIIGGGTAGLVLAARLTEDPNVTVGVLEAGQNRLADPNILVPGFEQNAAGHPGYDWMFQSVPQTSINDRVIVLPRGKVLGGSSAINGMVCTYASKENIDNWAKLGNPGWSFDDLAPYYKKFETFTAPSKDTAEFYQTSEIIQKNLHDGDGPVDTSFSRGKQYGGDAWVETFDKIGLKMLDDPQTGRGNGGYTPLLTIDPASSTRSYSATAYYAPYVHRPNLTLLTEALVTKITFEHRGHLVFASGVAFTSLGNSYHVAAKREVLVCGGSIKSPQILEVSGIGSKEVLEPLGIDMIVNNPNVGENFQDHGETPLSFFTAEGAITFDSLAIPGVAEADLADFYAHQNGLLSSLITSTANVSYTQLDQRASHPDIKHLKNALKAAIKDAATPSLKKQYELIGDILLDPHSSSFQILFINFGFSVGESRTAVPGSFVTLLSVFCHPFSRGSVHTTSKDLDTSPAIDPKYFSHPVDLLLSKDVILFCQDLATKEPLASKLKDGGKAFRPGFEHLTRETAPEFCKKAVQSGDHQVGTCAMMSEELGGVVDTRLKVYGVENLRVVDASIFPLLIRNNLQTAVYAVAERAADMIKEDWGSEHHVGIAKNGLKRDATPELKHNGKRMKSS